AAYHDPCHQVNLLKAVKEPRELLTKAGVELLEPKHQICCGFGGTFSFFFQELSGKILDNSVRELKDTGCEAIVTSCPNCILQLSKSMTDRPIYHIIEILEEALCEPGSIEE
ncbi:MAG: (Fe-S)-binding protein, partial [Nitrospirae bacterium]|nr:(Fe-S)-binding protein [Nitrospirota bacterium]